MTEAQPIATEKQSSGPSQYADDPLHGVPDDSLDRVERVIATSRVLLSIAALVVLILDPRQPVYSARALYIVLSTYIVYSGWLLWLFTYRTVHSRAASRPVLIADVAWFTIIVGLSEGSTSPFFLFYLFAVTTAATRWGIRTTIRVAVVSAVLYLASVLAVRRLVMGPDFSMHSAHLMRPIYLILLGYLVGFIGEHELSAKRRLIEMVSMLTEIAGKSRSPTRILARLLQHVVRFFAADYVLLQLRLPDGTALEWEGSRQQANERLKLRNIEPTPWTPAAARPISYRVSHSLGNWGRRVEAFAPDRSRIIVVSERDEPGFLSRSRARSLISIPIQAAGGARGRLMFGRLRANFSRDELDFCHALVRQGTMILDNVLLQAKAEELAVAEERARIARDVHDGFVQSLASLDVGIEVCRRLQSRDPARLATELEDLQRTVKQGYREARRYLDRLRDRPIPGPEINEALRELVRDFREHADITIEFECEPLNISVRNRLGYEVLQIVREGLTNILRHARARHAKVALRSRNGSLELRIRDDGHGFPSAPETPGELPATAAPWSIRERVDALGGGLLLRSGAGSGSEITITLPRSEQA